MLGCCTGTLGLAGLRSSVSHIVYLGVVDRQLRLHHLLGGLGSSRAGDIDRVELAGSVPRGVVDRGSWGVVGGPGVGGGLVATVGKLRVGSGAFVRHLGYISTIGVGTILDMLDPAVRERH